MMDQKKLERIKEYLQKPEVKLRIQENMLKGHNEATVTISRAAELFGFTVNQLRDWEKKGLLKPSRTETSENKSIPGQRQYSIYELDKLAIIQELTHKVFSPGAIPTNIYEIWSSLVESDQQETIIDLDKVEQEKVVGTSSNGDKFLPINVRADSAYLDHYSWRFYASHALLMALMLVAEEVPGTYSGLILPFKKRLPGDPLPSSSNLSEIGESLVGWSGQTHTFSTLFVPTPSFEYPSDFRILPLSVDGKYEHLIEPEEDRTLIFVQRDEASKLNLTKDVVETAKILLRPLYEDRQGWQRYFGEGMKDLVRPGINFTPRLPDMMLIGLANMTVRLGGKKEDGQDRWRFCYIFLPDNLHLPLQQRNLVVRAMSKNTRHVIGTIALTPERYRTSISIRAFQSGHIMYRQELSMEDITPENSVIEGPIHSTIAVPIGGERGREPLGVIYVASHDTHAFSEQDCRVLRMIARIIEELQESYAVQRQSTENLVEVVREPETVDPSFKEFSSENDFITAIEEYLKQVRSLNAFENEELLGKKDFTIANLSPIVSEISFIAIDIDNQDFIVRDYDEGTLRNLQKTIGLRIRDLLPALFTRYVDCSLYHIYAGRFYLFLRGFSLEDSKRKASRLKDALEGNIAIKLPDLLGRTIIISNVSLHLAVTSYSNEKLKEFIDMDYKVVDISSIIYQSLDSVLKSGMNDGGNVIYAWDPENATFNPYISK
jgi:DNA-binding transcriptional MerR regulator